MPLRHPLADPWVAGAIARQYGLVTKEQLHEAGLSRRRIERLIDQGILIVRFRGVYAVGHEARDPRADEMAVLLALGAETVLSHRTAGAFWGLCDRPRLIEVIQPRRGSVGLAGVRAHRVETLYRDEWLHADGLAVTTVARTLLDLAGLLDEQGLAAAYAAADRQGRIRHSEIRRVLTRGNRKGSAALRRLYWQRDPSRRPTRSDFERMVFDSMRRRRRFELPETNQMIAGREVDMVWRKKRLMVELDGYRNHSGDDSFNSDRARDLEMERRGFTVVRISWQMWAEDPARVLDSLTEILAAR